MAYRNQKDLLNSSSFVLSFNKWSLKAHSAFTIPLVSLATAIALGPSQSDGLTGPGGLAVPLTSDEGLEEDMEGELA